MIGLWEILKCPTNTHVFHSWRKIDFWKKTQFYIRVFLDGLFPNTFLGLLSYGSTECCHFLPQCARPLLLSFLTNFLQSCEIPSRGLYSIKHANTIKCNLEINWHHYLRKLLHACDGAYARKRRGGTLDFLMALFSLLNLKKHETMNRFIKKKLTSPSFTAIGL